MENLPSNPDYKALIASLSVRFPSFGAVGSAAFKPGLERVEAICALLGNPQKRYRTIHVAGTNGKGSTANMTAASLASSGLAAGLYTSPHILDFRERMRVVTASGVTMPSEEYVLEFWDRWGDECDRLDLSFFEITTAMAFDFFARSGVQAAVIETGLGGRLDATNIITPELSVITNIGYDHTDILGPTLAAIAGEKAGIIKPGVPVVIGESHPETDPVFESVAASAGAPIRFADREALPVRIGDLDFETVLAGMDLQGSYQRKNLRTVLCALDVLGVTPNPGALMHAATICEFHGRWEKVCDNPLTICDIGHNEHGLKYNFAQLDGMLDRGEVTDLVMVYGSVADKDVDAVLRILPGRSRIFFTCADNHRAMPAGELAVRFARLRASDTAASAHIVVPRVADAVGAALGLCRSLTEHDAAARPMIYIGGSTYIVSEALGFLKAPHAESEES